jgi:hypothetical protein
VKPRARFRTACVAAVAALCVAGVVSAAGAGSSSRSSGWTWSAAVPGDALPAAADATATGARELAAVGDFALVASEKDGVLMIGPLVGGRVQLESPATVASEQPLIVYSAAVPEGGQQVVGVARADVDRVDAVHADGTIEQLPLNEWRGFGYAAAAPDAASTLVAYAGGSAVGTLQLPQTTTQAADAGASAAPVYGIFRASFAEQTVRISRVNARTLQPEGRALQLVSQVLGLTALSPDGSALAFVSSKPSALVIVDLQSMRVARRLPLTAGDRIRALSWPQRDRLIELRQVMKGPYQRNVGSRTVASVDPKSGNGIGSSRLNNKLAIHGSVSTRLGLVLLLGSSGLHGPTVELALATPDGGAETVQLAVGMQKGVTRSSVLAVDSAAGHAYVAAAGGLVFDVDLKTMTATSHVVSAPSASGILPPPIGFLQAEVLGHNLVVAGMFPAKSAPVAQGVMLIDTRSWQVRVVDAGASRFSVLGDRLLTYGQTTLPPTSHAASPFRVAGHGLTLYDGGGTRLAHLYGSRRFQDIFLAPGYGHVLYNGKSSGTVPQPGKRYPRGAVYYSGPNDQLVFDLASGAALGGGVLSHQKPPLGPPWLVFRGSAMVGESGDRLPSAVVSPAATTPTPVTAPGSAAVAATP